MRAIEVEEFWVAQVGAARFAVFAWALAIFQERGQERFAGMAALAALRAGVFSIQCAVFRLGAFDHRFGRIYIDV